jgi:uncharacterized protein (DUF362 family)
VVVELLVDSGITANNIYIVEALWDDASYNNFGYLDVQTDLGVQMINLNSATPYQDFIQLEVGDNGRFYSSFTVTPILNETDVYVSIPKMKQHFEAGVTHSIKNQVGIVPKQNYIYSKMNNMRSALHFEGGDIGTHLPNSICDLNLARPVHLAVIDGINNAIGGEGHGIPRFSRQNIKFCWPEKILSQQIMSLHT